MINDLEVISFHDVYILGISIYTEKDHFDNINLFLESDNFIDKYETDKVTIEFKECFKAKLLLQMWICGKDSINKMEIKEVATNNCREFFQMKEKGFFKENINFNQCEITLNTSSSKIEIFAKEVRIKY